MNQCSYCKKPLINSLDEFGDPRQPYCLQCFLFGREEEARLLNQYEELQKELKDLDEEERHLFCWEEQKELDDQRCQILQAIKHVELELKVFEAV